MSAKKLWIRLNALDAQYLDNIAKVFDGSRSQAIRFLLRQWQQEKEKVGTVPTPPRPT